MKRRKRRLVAKRSHVIQVGPRKPKPAPRRRVRFVVPDADGTPDASYAESPDRTPPEEGSYSLSDDQGVSDPTFDSEDEEDERDQVEGADAPPLAAQGGLVVLALLVLLAQQRGRA